MFAKVKSMDERYHLLYAAAAVRGHFIRHGLFDKLGKELSERELPELTREDCERLLELGREQEIKLYHFKRSDRMLPRVHKVLGFLKGIYFENLLDVGSGRGVFLLPFLDEFPYAEVTSLDILDKRVKLLEDISVGGVKRLSVKKASICDKPFPDDSFDVVTMLEVLEHIPDVEGAIRAAVKMSRNYVIVTVPSKEDDNPEHIHLLTKEVLTRYFNACGVTKLSFDGVPGHLFMIAKI